jgi:hypothetical protein
MQGGSLLLQEDIEQLRQRFREVSVTLSASRQPAEPMPEDWLLPATSGHHLRFIASRYEGDDALYPPLTRRFGAVRMQSEPMPLREIANALMQDRKRSGKP